MPALMIHGLSKSFGEVNALRNVSFQVEPGNIHALIGRNGSGKSTLVKLLSGYHEASVGAMNLSSASGSITDLSKEQKGIAFVHQDLGVIGELTILDNMMLGKRPLMKRGRINWGAETEMARAALAPFGLDAYVEQPLDSLSKEQATIVAIARAVYRDDELSVLVLDEPTSLLPRTEGAVLFETMRTLRDKGIALLFITHDLNEVLDIADHMTVLRDGAVVGSLPVSGLEHDDLVRLMVGESYDSSSLKEGEPQTGQVVMDLKNVSREELDDVSFEVRAGEVVGITGLMGGGLDEIALVASGREQGRGTVRVRGEDPARNMESVGFIPGERLTLGLFLGMSIRENITVASGSKFVKRLRISEEQERAAADSWIGRLNLVPGDSEAPIDTLSGGNQQKAVLARWLSLSPSAIIAKDPTQGVDIAAKREILSRLRGAAKAGTAVLICSYEFEEIMDACDRVLVLREGKIAAEFVGKQVRSDSIMKAVQ